jgi:hypothetical protein
MTNRQKLLAKAEGLLDGMEGTYNSMIVFLCFLAFLLVSCVADMTDYLKEISVNSKHLQRIK